MQIHRSRGECGSKVMADRLDLVVRLLEYAGESGPSGRDTLSAYARHRRIELANVGGNTYDRIARGHCLKACADCLDVILYGGRCAIPRPLHLVGGRRND